MRRITGLLAILMLLLAACSAGEFGMYEGNDWGTGMEPSPTVVVLDDEGRDQAGVRPPVDIAENPIDVDTARNTANRLVYDSIAEVLAAREETSTLAGLLEQVDLAAELGDGGAMTIFAPTNQAFESLPQEELDRLLADPQLLADVLRYHIIDGGFDGEELVRNDIITTLSGQQITTSSNGRRVSLNNEQVHVYATTPVANGFIHYVDAVLLPPQQ
jgi:uncharacterized surface protein with fasciclin (FAS1) repeats